MKFELFNERVRVKKTGRTGIIVDDEWRTKDGQVVYIVEYDVWDDDDPVGDYLEDDLEAL